MTLFVRSLPLDGSVVTEIGTYLFPRGLQPLHPSSGHHTVVRLSTAYAISEEIFANSKGRGGTAAKDVRRLQQWQCPRERGRERIKETVAE